MHQLTNRIKISTLPRRLLFALRDAKSLHLTNVLVLLLCYSIVIQPNAALAAQSNHVIALATLKGSEAKQGTPVEVKGSTTPGLLSWLGNLFSSSAPEPPPVPEITDAVVSRRKPTLNSGWIEGSLRAFSGDNFAVAGQFQLTGDMFTAGTPTINVQNGASYGGVISDGGSTSPSGYTVTLQTGVAMPGKIHRQADPLQLPADIPTSVPAASGTRSVTISSAADLSSIGDWATVRDITVNAAGLTIDVPPGNYRKLSIGSTSQLNFSAGTYNFSDTITMNNGGKIQATSKVIITVANALNINYGFITLGANTLPGDVRLNLVTTAGCSLNGSSQFSALVRAPNTTLHLNGTSQIRGQVIANYVDFNGCHVIGDVSTTPPPDTTLPIISITSPADNFPTTNAAITVRGTASDPGANASGIAQVTVNNIPATYDASSGNWSLANFALAPGANPITARAVDVAGNAATQSITVTRQVADTTAPTVSISSPLEGSTTVSETTTVSGTASDVGANASGVAQVTVNGAPATFNSATGAWTISNVSLPTIGSNPISARARDTAGNLSPETTIHVIRQSPQDTTSPIITISSPANGSTTQDETITVSGTVSDPGLYPSGIAHVTVNGVSASVAPDGSWSISGVALTVGSNTIAIHADDNAGNPADQSISVTRQPPPDTTGPTLAITSPGDGSTTQQETITVSGNVSDPGQYASGVASVTVNDIAASLDVNAGTWTVSNVPLSSLGSHAIVARAVDVAGNPSTPQTINVIRQAPPDVTAPTLAITSPTDGYSTLAETVAVSGTVSDPGQYPTGVAQVTVNGATASLDLQAGTWTVSGVALAIGQTTVTATAVDNAGNPTSQSITITRNTPPDTQAPTIAITAPLNNSVTPNATITVTGTAIDEGAYATGVRRVVVNGQIASYDPATHQWIAADVPLNEGPNTIQVFADDNAPVPNPTETSVSVTRHTPDTRPPTVTITSPSPSLETYDATVIVTGTAVDDGLNATGVDHVTVNGATASYDAASGQWSVAAVALAYGDNTIVVVATDKAPTPNQGTAQVQITRIKIPPPTLTISNPQNGAVLAATSITVAGIVSSMGNTPSVTVNGETAVVSGGQFARTVPLVEGANAITVIATDSLQQPTQASLSVIRDMLPPAVSFANVPASVQPGGTYQILVDATDNVGIADVEFRVNGQYVATSSAAPYEFTLAVPTVYAAGTNLVLSAVARDLTNTTAVATAQTRSGGPGGVSGYVFDDATGYVLPGVNASLNNQAPVVTDELGVFNLVSTSPSGVVRLSKDGHTPVDRLYSVSIGEGTALFDARLTPLDSHANNIGVSGGAASGDSGRIQVSIAPGTFADTTDLRATSISPQGLENLLPYGWSPVPGAIVDLRSASGSASQSLAGPAHLTVSQVAGLNAATPLVLARYDETSHRWMVVAAGIYATSDGENGSLSADLARLGQYAFLVADTGATSPPAAVPGQPLTASQPADSAALDAAQASAVASPRTAVFSSSARSAISFFATSPTQLPSGVSIEATFGETYNLLGGRDSVLVDRPAQDFVLYAYPAASAAQPNRLGAFFIAKPTRTDFTITELFNANVHVDIRSGRQSQVGALIDGGGGSVRAGNGSELIIPANALSRSQSVFFEDLQTNLAGVTLPDGYEIVGAFDLNLGSATLSASATISLPGVSGDLSRIVVARLMTVGGARSPKVVARAAADATGKLSSTVAPPLVPAGVPLSGIRSSGRYVFIRVPQPFGYVKGSVNDAAGGNPLGMVKVSSNQTPFIDVTAADGQFVVVGAAGANPIGLNQIGAAALTTDATGKTSASLDEQDAVANVNISVSTVPLGVESITPASNAQNMIATTPVTVTFNKPIASSSITGSTFTLSTAAGNPVLGNITVLAGNRVVVFTPASTLAASTNYKVTLSRSIKDIYGHALPADFNSTFATAATVTVSNRLRPEQIVIGYPDANGMSSISIPAGSVPEGSNLLVVNTTSGSTLSTVAGTGALALQIQARVGDEITLTITQPDGTQYRVTQAAYRRADGFISVGSNGGVITSDDGQILLSVPAGAISGQADLKLSRRLESDITIPRTGEMDPSNVPFGAGVRISVGGNFTNDQELHLEVAAPATAVEGQRVAFMSPAKFTDASGEHDVWEVITSGKTEGGKFKTLSPPFFGVTINATVYYYDYDVFMPRNFRAVTGIVTEHVNNGAPKPLANVKVHIASSPGNPPASVTATTAANGRFGTLDFAVSSASSVDIVATDTLGRTETVGATPYLNYSTLQNPGLNGLSSMYAAIEFPSSDGLPETLPALLHMEGRMLDLESGQPDTLQAVGRVLLGSHLEIKTIATPDVKQITGQLLAGGTVVRQLVWSNPSPGSGVYVTDFNVQAEGSYSVSVTTHTQTNVPTTKATAAFNFVAQADPNTRPSLEGPPHVLTVTPGNQAQQVNTGTRIHLDFSEPVKNLVAGQTIYLTNLSSGARMGGYLTSGGLPFGPTQANISSVDLQPSQTLEANKEYAIEVTTGVTDSENNAFDQEYTVPGDTSAQPFRSTFKTFHSFVLTEVPPETDSYRLAVAGDLGITVTPGFGSTMHIWDFTNPDSPKLLSDKFVPNYATAFDIADAELDEDYIKVGESGNQTYRTIAVVTSLTPQDTSRPINLWIFSLDDPTSSRMIGVVSLNISDSVPAFPMYVKIHHKRAYIGNTGRGGVEMVDLQAAVNQFAKDGVALAGLRAVQPNGGYDQEAKKQKATYGHSNVEAAPVYSVSLMDQNVPAVNGSGAAKSPVAYIASNKLQLISFDFNESHDNDLVFKDANGDTFDDHLLAAKDLNPAGLALDVRAVPSVNLQGQATDLAVLLGAERLWIFNVTNPREPTAYPTRSFMEMGLGPDYARRIDVEGTLAYVMFIDKVAVIDFSDPAHPFVSSTITDIGTNLRWMAVKDGFVYTLDGVSDTRTAKMRTSIGGAAALVYMHGANSDAENVCANPVLISRTDGHMLQDAEMIFKVYGHDTPQSKKVIIRKEIRSNDETIFQTLATLSVTLDAQSPQNIVAGRARWVNSAPIDRSALYTAELVLDEGQPTEFRARRVEIPFSYLIEQYQEEWGIPLSNGVGHFPYLLGGSATLTLMVQGPDNWRTIELQNGNRRVYGFHNEEMLRSLSGLNSLPQGRYQFTLTAQAIDLVGVNETVVGNVNVGEERRPIRQPGSIVVGGVELESGNLGLTHTDIPEIKNRGLSLSFTRSYNSAGSSGFNPFGYGWHHNYQVLLTHYTQGNPSDPNSPIGPYYEILGGEGSGVTFNESDVAVGVEAKARAPYWGTLRKNADNTFDYFTRSHIQYHFQQEMKSGSVYLFNQGYMGNLAYIEEPHGNRITLSYDGQGRLFSVTDPAGRKLEFTYEQALTPFVGAVDSGSIVGEATNCTSRRFMRSLRQRFLQAELGRAWHIIQVKGPGGIEINYDYDGNGNLERATRSGSDGISESTADSVWQYAYNPTAGPNPNPNYSHLITSVKAPNQTLAASRLTTYKYELDQPGRPIKTITMPEGVEYGYSYTFSSGRITGTVVTDGRANSTSYQFASAGSNKTVTVLAPRGAQSVITFDERGNRLSETDPEGMTTSYRYDNGNPVEVTVSGQGLVQRRVATYDSTFNKLTSLTDAKQQTTTYTVDGRGNVTRIQLPTGRAVIMDYAANGDLQRLTDQYGFTTSYESYDLYGNAQTIRRQTSGSTLVTSHQTFDGRSRRKTSDGDLEPSVTSNYDALDHLIQQTVSDPSGFRDAQTSTMTYLVEGQLKTMTRSGSGQQLSVVNDYDALNRVVLTTETASGAAPFVRPFKYDRNSNLEEETDRRGVKRTQTYDELNFVTSETLSGPYGASLQTMSAQELDKVGNPKVVRNLYGQTIRMDYDGLHRLVMRRLPGNFTEEFAYDDNGNITSSKDRNGRETTFEFDPLNRQKLMRDPGNRVTTWTYDDATRSTTIQRAPQGLTESIQEDGLGRLLRRAVQFGSNNYVTTNVYLGRRVTTTDPRGTVSVRDLSAFEDLGRLTVNGADPAFTQEMHYAALGGLRSSKDALNRETTYTLDGLGRATEIGYPGGFSESFTYDGEGLVVSHTDRRSAVSTMTYDNLRRQLSEKVQDGAQQISVLTTQYDDTGNSETRTDADGHATLFVFDGLRRLSSLTNADNKSKSYVYDGMDLRRESDFKGNFTEYEYDALDRISLMKDRKGQVVNIANSDSNGYTRTTTDRRGNVQVQAYDPLGRIIRETQGGEALASYQYDGNNNRTLMTDGVGNETTYSYDKLNRVKTISHANLQTETFTYDAVGNVLAFNDGRGPSISMEYDELNHLKTRTDGEGNVARSRYDGEGLLLEKIDPKGGAYKTTYNYNALGSLKQITDAKSGVWEFEYDGTQDLKSVKDALDRVVSYDYDSLNRLERITQPQNLVTRFGYDANNNRNSTTDPKGQVTTIVYDELDRPDTLTYANTSGAGPLGFDFDFDPENNLTSVKEKITPTTTRSYSRSYDSRNRLLSTTDPFNRTVSFTYFATNKLKSIKDAAQKETSYTYDTANRLQNVTMNGASAAYSWYADGLLKQVDYGAGMKREYTYDDADRLKQVTNTVGTEPSTQTQQFIYGYDSNSNRESETRKVNGQTTRGVAYTYDLLDRLTSAAYTTPGQRPANPPPGQSVSYTETLRDTDFDYDAVGNRKSASAQDHTTTITLTTDNNGATTESRQTVDGPLVATTAQFNELNRLIQLTNNAAGSAPVTYGYDNNGNLSSTTQSGQVTAQYEYDCRDQLRRALGAAGQELASYDYDFERHRISKTVGAAALKYVYGSDQVIGEYNAGNQLQNRYDIGSNEVVRAELGGEGTRHYFSDGLSSVTALAQQNTTTSSSLTAAYEYDAWGNYFSTNGASNNLVGYTGQRFDIETGLMPLGNGERYYSPTAGSFIQQDSFSGAVAMTQSLNRYAYVQNNPLRFIDRSGHQGKEPTNDPDAVTHVVEGGAKAVINLLLEPFRQVADIVVANEAANEGIAAEHVQLSSMLGKSSQQAVLAGQDPWDVALHSIHGQIYNYATLGVGPLAEGLGSDMAAYHDGQISLAEYNKRMGGHLVSVGMFYFGARAARKAGQARAAVYAEDAGVLGSERLPLRSAATAEGAAPKASAIRVAADAPQIGPAGNPGGLGTLESRIPYGFESAEAFESFGARLKSGLREAGYTDVEPGFQGSAVTGIKFTTRVPFDIGRLSDFDIALSSPELLARAKQVGVPLRSGGIRTGPLNLGQLKRLGLADLSSDLSQTAGRPVNFMIFDSVKSATSKAPTIGVP